MKFNFIIKYAYRLVRRHPAESLKMILLSFLAAFLCMIIFSCIEVFQYQTKAYSEKFILFITLDNESSQTVTSVIGEVEKIRGIEKVRQVSAEDALGFFSKNFGVETGQLIQGSDFPDILIASVMVEYQKPAEFYNLPGKLRMVDGVEDVIYRDDVIKSVIDARDFTWKVSIIGALLSLSLLFMLIQSMVLPIIQRRSGEIRLFGVLGSGSGFVSLAIFLKTAATFLTGAVLASVVFILIRQWLINEMAWLHLDQLNMIMNGIIFSFAGIILMLLLSYLNNFRKVKHKGILVV